jgi:hypothetical protein
MKTRLVALALAISAPALAAPPPPPPEYLDKATQVLIHQAPADDGEAALLFSDDVTASENGNTIADGKANWLRWRNANLKSHDNRVLGYSEGYVGEGAALLIVETFDTVDRSRLPPTAIADPRMATRSILYQFGADHLIHSVRISRADGFWITPNR